MAAVDPTLLGTATLQDQACTTDYVIIDNPSQTGTPLTTGIDRFCGLGLRPTTSKISNNKKILIFVFPENFSFYRFIGNVKPFILTVVTDGNEAMDSGNRGFALAYAQNLCPVVSK